MNIRVTIFEDHKNVLSALEQLVSCSPGFEVAGAFLDAREVLDKMEKSRPDVVLMDIHMPGINGIEALTAIKKYHPEIKVVMQTVFEDDENVFASICAGASGYILKNSKPERFIEAINEAFYGGAPMTGSIALKVLSLFQRNFGKSDLVKQELSARETEILQHLVKGESYKIIASHCHITYDTVRFHIKNIYAKLHVTSMTEAVAKAIYHRLV